MNARPVFPLVTTLAPGASAGVTMSMPMEIF